MDNEGFDYSQADMSQLLEEHDYDMPKEGDMRTGVIVSMTPQGIILDLGLKRDGLVPPSEVNKLADEIKEKLKVNEEVLVYIENTREPDSLHVSIQKALLYQDWIQAEELMHSGQIIEVEIAQFNRGGAIAPFGNLRGFIPASHLTDFSRNMSDKVRQQRINRLRGEKIPVKIIEVDRDRRRLVMSQRDAQKEWAEARRQELMQKLNVGDVVSGRVTGMRDFGAFVDIGGADGLIHISELAWHRVKHPRDVVKVGDEVEVYILKLEHDSQRIALSRRRAVPSPWELAVEKYATGQLVEGTVTRLVDYGAFVQVEPGIEGLLHISQLSVSNVGHPREVVREGEVHLLRVISFSPERQRIGLSLKAVTSSEQMDWMARKNAEAQAEAAAKAEAKAKAAAKAEAAAAAEAAEAEAEATETEAAVETEAAAEMKVATEAEALAETEAAAEMEVATEAEAAAEAEVAAEMEAGVETEAAAEAEAPAEAETAVEMETPAEMEVAAAVETPEMGVDEAAAAADEPAEAAAEMADLPSMDDVGDAGSDEEE